MKRTISRSSVRGSSTGSAITLLLVVALLGLGAWLMLRDKKPGDATATDVPGTSSESAPGTAVVDSEAPVPIEPVSETSLMSGWRTRVEPTGSP